MTIVLTFATEEGEEKKVKFVDNVTDIELNIDAFGIQKLGPRSETIDLTPLQSCTDLRTLSIWGFSLREIDLSPLSNCRNLESLRVSAMMWSPIDLSPLKSCPNLRNLCLSGNYFRELDITPLKHCHDLQSLELYSTFIKTIDLCPLKYCVRLKSFAVSTALEHIDLTPFGLCTDLRFLDLGRNQLQDLDLEPLCSCTRLQELHLEKNHLNSIDLGPLASCAYLRSVRLEGNRFKTIDLSPLSSCSRLSKIFLHGNMMEELDITPLQFLPGLEEIRFHNTSKLSSWIKYPRLNWPLVQKYRGGYMDQRGGSLSSSGLNYAPPVPEDSWELLHRLALIPRRTFSIAVQDYIQRTLGLANYGLIDSDLFNVFQTIPSESSLDDARQTLEVELAERVCEQIDRGGTTIGLSVDELLHIGDIAARMKDVYELRDAEIKRTTIFRIADDRWVKSDGRFDVSGLWITAYGYDVLCTLGLAKMQVREKHIEEIRKVLHDIGNEIDVVEVETPADIPQLEKDGMSAAMVNFVLALGAYSFQYSWSPQAPM